MRRWLAPILIGLTLGVALLITLARPATSPPGGSALRLPTPVPPPTTTPEAPRGDRPTLTFAEEQRTREAAGVELTRAAIVSGPGQTAAGKHTAGSVITVAGKSVQLPADAWVAEYAAMGQCPAGSATPCPEVPFMVIQRRTSTISIGLRTGKVNWENTVPGEEDAFDFLRPYVITPTPPRPN